ncbi:MAG: RES family NAD+ phosphorylase [Ramlibacter sp.]
MKIPLNIPDDFAKRFLSLGEHLRRNGRFSITSDHEYMVGRLLKFWMEHTTTVDAGTLLYRARIWDVDRSSPYQLSEMGAPPAHGAKSGRINPEGIPYLYLAEAAETAIAEVRPWKGAYVSVGIFQIKRPVRCADTSIPNDKVFGLQFPETDEYMGEWFMSYFLATHYFGSPAHNDDRFAYFASQYIAERVRNRGCGALVYPSVLREGGKNYALFDPATAECVQVIDYGVTGVTYDYLPAHEARTALSGTEPA